MLNNNPALSNTCLPEKLFHWRRLCLSYLYQYLLLLISNFAKLAQAARQHPVLAISSLILFSLGLCFTLRPDWVLSVFSLTASNSAGLVEVRSYYGTSLLGFAIFLSLSLSQKVLRKSAYIWLACFALTSSLGRLIGCFFHPDAVWPQGIIGALELGAGIYICLNLEKLLQGKKRKRHESLLPDANDSFADPYQTYKTLRDQYPVYKAPGQDFYFISRYDDVCELAKDTVNTSNKLVEILATGKPKNPNIKGLSLIERVAEAGVIPVDVMALQDPPIHTQERKIGHSGFNARFVKSLEPEVAQLCQEMINELLPSNDSSNLELEFVQTFAWRLPMRLIIRLLALPEEDFPQIKNWCEDGIQSLSGTAEKADLIAIGASAAEFMRYLWHHYLRIKNGPEINSFTYQLSQLAGQHDSIMTDQRAVATLFQLLIAGSDSSASSMGSALLKLAQDRELQQELRQQPELIERFIEEIFRTESAFQGHFRLTTAALHYHGVDIPANSRLFLSWGSANRDPRFWENAETFDIHRSNVKKHLTFGHGVHACIGRELARMEIQIVVKQFLALSTEIQLNGDIDYEASIFARTLKQLPLTIKLA